MNNQDQNLNLISIGDASNYLGVSIDTLRRWEKRGRIIPYRSPGGHRYYKKDDLDQLFGKRYTHDPSDDIEEIVDESIEQPLDDMNSVEPVPGETTPQETNPEPVKPVIIVEEEIASAQKEIKIPEVEPIRVEVRPVYKTESSDVSDSEIAPSLEPIVPTALEPDIQEERKETATVEDRIDEINKDTEEVKIETSTVETHNAPPPSDENQTGQPKDSPSPVTETRSSLIPQVSSSQKDSPALARMDPVPSQSTGRKKETVTIIIIVSILFLVILLGVILFIMLWQSSRNVLSPSP